MASFPASERLKSRTALLEVYKRGKSVVVFPYRLNYLPYQFEGNHLVKIAVAVPKKKVKSAVKRNRLKRQIKEAYRLNKAPLLNASRQKDQGLALFLLYVGSEQQSFSYLEGKLKMALKKVVAAL